MGVGGPVGLGGVIRPGVRVGSTFVDVPLERGEDAAPADSKAPEARTPATKAAEPVKRVVKRCNMVKIGLPRTLTFPTVQAVEKLNATPR